VPRRAELNRAREPKNTDKVWLKLVNFSTLADCVRVQLRTTCVTTKQPNLKLDTRPDLNA
jgi:hypothetical protein